LVVLDSLVILPNSSYTTVSSGVPLPPNPITSFTLPCRSARYQPDPLDCTRASTSFDPSPNKRRTTTLLLSNSAQALLPS
jgi:hypothetical protein